MAKASVHRLKAKLRPKLRAGRGRSLARVCCELGPVLRGWVAYYRLSEVKAAFEKLGQWLRRNLRRTVWRQWRRARTCFKELCRAGLDRVRAATSAYNGHGTWWKAGASHMNHALPTRTLRREGLISLIEEHRRLTSA